MTYKIVDVGSQGGEQWLAWRKGKMSASIIASIIGLDPWCTRLQRYNKIMDDEENVVNEAMREGTRLEPIARELINTKYGTKYEAACIESTKYPWMIASLDAYDPNAGMKIREIKCPGQKTHAIAERGDVPEYYLPQLQWQMWLTGEHEMLYDSFHGKKLVTVVVHRQDLFINKMVECAQDFYNRLLNFDPPDPCDKDYVEIKDEEAIGLSKEFERLNELYKRIDTDRDLVRRNLIKMCRGQSSKVGNVKLLKTTRNGAIDYSKIPELKEMDLSKYRKDRVEMWRFY